jgi:hypothetical protein
MMIACLGFSGDLRGFAGIFEIPKNHQKSPKISEKSRLITIFIQLNLEEK